MKKTIFISILCVIFNALLNSQQTGNFYYYQGEKIFLQQNSNKIFIKFAQKADRKQISELINDNASLQLAAGKNIDDHSYYFVILETKNENDLVSSAVLQTLRASPVIVSATPLFLYNKLSQGLTDEFVVKLKSTTSRNQLEELTEKNNCFIKEENLFVSNQFMLSVSKNANMNAMEMSRLFYESNLFEFAEPNFVLIDIFNSNDTYFDDQWALKNIGQNGGISGVDIKAEEAWTVALGANIKVAVVDLGVDLTHPDLQTNLLPGYDATGHNSGGAPIYSDENHGTACAGIIGAIKDNRIGIAGVAPNCNIIPIHVAFGDISTADWLADAINWGRLNGADVISNSWGGGSPYSPITNAVNNAVTQGREGKGCVVVFSSGNDNASTVSYPANLPNVISVGANDKCGIRVNPNSCDPWNPFQGSNFGTALSVVAPGANIYTTDRQGREGYNTESGTAGDYYCCFGGTSAACPHVAGIAALILSVNSNLTWLQVRDIIESTAQKVREDLYDYGIEVNRPNGTWHLQMGYGLVNAYAAVQAVCIDTFANQTITIDRTVVGCDNLNVQDVTVTNSAKLTLEAPGSITINGPFSVSAGSKFSASSVD